jgi:hypothetical protein
MPRQFQNGPNVLTSAPQLAAAVPPAAINPAQQVLPFEKSSTIKLPSQVLLVFVDGQNGDAVIDRLANAPAALKIPLNTGDRLKSIDGLSCFSAKEALANIQSLNNGSSADVALDFVSRSGFTVQVIASRQQVRPALARALTHQF